MTEDKPVKAPELPQPADIKAEIKAMGAAYEALRGLDGAAQRRAGRWLEERLAADRLARDGGRYDDEPPF